MFSERFRKKSLIYLYTTLIISIACIVFCLFKIINGNHDRQALILNKQDILINSSANLISQKAHSLQAMVDNISTNLTNGKFRLSDIENLHINNDKSILGLGIVYIPNITKGSKNIYWQNKGIFIESSLYEYDYTANMEQNQWYISALNNQRVWSRPYYDGSSEEFMVSYSAPFFDKDNHIIGVVVVDVDLSIIDEFIANNLGNKYITIINANGDYIYKYDKKYSLLGMNIANTSDPKDKQLFSDVKQNCTNKCLRELSINKVKSTFIINKLETVPWFIFAEYTPEYLSSLDRNTDNVTYIALIVFSYVLIICVMWLFIVSKSSRKYVKKFLWRGSISTSILLSMCIASIWYVSSKMYYLDTNGAITNTQILNFDLNQFESDAKLKKIENLVKIPTAVLVNSVKFIDSYEINLHGNIMQRYRSGESELSGFRLNDSSDGNIRLISIKHTPTYDIATWAFDINIRHSINYNRYPFTHGNIWFAISPSSNRENVVLVPDFTYYNGLNDISKSNGINAQVVIPNWNISGTYFDFINDITQMSDSVNSYRALSLPSLKFNILVSSNLANGIITTMVPFIVIVVILFITLLTISRKPNDHIRFDVPRLVAATTGIFFTLIFAHATLRNKILADLMYIEYIYLIFYLVLLLLIVNAFQFARKTNSLVMYGDNFLIKIIAVPLLLFITLVVTIIFFI